MTGRGRAQPLGGDVRGMSEEARDVARLSCDFFAHIHNSSSSVPQASCALPLLRSPSLAFLYLILLYLPCIFPVSSTKLPTLSSPLSSPSFPTLSPQQKKDNELHLGRSPRSPSASPPPSSLGRLPVLSHQLPASLSEIPRPFPRHLFRPGEQCPSR